MIDFGTVKPGTTLYIPFHTFDSNDPSASVTLTGLATSDIEIYSNGSVTQRASDAGYALLDTDGIDFDGVTGIHGFSIDLADNTTAGFYAAGNQYWVVVASVTVDAATVNFIAATFRIGYPDAVINTTIASLSSQTSFTLTAGPAEDDALNGCVVAIHDVASAVQMGFAVVSDYTGASKTVTLTAGTTFTAAASDNIAVYPPANARWFAALATVALPLTPTTAGRTLDVSAGGEAGVDWANVGSPTTAVGLTGTTISTSQTIAWNAAWDAEVQSEVEDGLVAHRLDELLNADSDIDGAAPPTVGSVFHELMTKTAGSFTYDQTTDSLEAVRDRGDAAWITATGFSTHSAADVWAVATRVLTAGTNINGSTFTAIPWNAAWDAEVQSEVQDALDAAVSEPAQGAPAANASISTSIKLLYKAWRNKSTQTSTQYSLYNDDAATIDHKATVSDDGTTLTRGEVATGP